MSGFAHMSGEAVLSPVRMAVSEIQGMQTLLFLLFASLVPRVRVHSSEENRELILTAQPRFIQRK